MEFRKQQDLDHILTWQPSEVSPTPSPSQGVIPPHFSVSPAHVQRPDGTGTWLVAGGAGCRGKGLIRAGTSRQVIQRYDSGGLCGYDYEGCPVWFDIIGNMDPKGLLLSASKQELIRKRIKACERLLQECELQSQKVRGWGRRGDGKCYGGKG